VQLGPRPAGRLGRAGHDGLNLARELGRAALVQRAGDAHLGDLASRRHDHLDRVVGRVHRHGMRRDHLVELGTQLVKTAISIDSLIDPTLVDLARHPPGLLTARKRPVAIRDQTVPDRVTLSLP